MSEPTGKTYRIETLADLRQVPRDRLDFCFRDLALWLDLTRAAEELFGDAFRFREGEDQCTGTRFMWLDDGEHGGTVKVYDHEGALIVEERVESVPEEPPTP